MSMSPPASSSAVDGLASADATGAALLPPVAALLVAGGDGRIVPDPASGLSMYGCGPAPEPGLVALGSSTASTVSARGLAAATRLRSACVRQLRSQSAGAVYAERAQRVRSELLALCGVGADAGVDALLAASGTDLHLLAGAWLQPRLTVLLAPAETGSGLPAALQGRHFGHCAAGGTLVHPGAPLGQWSGALHTLQPRGADGTLRAPAEVDADCRAAVDGAASTGQRVLLVLTDVSKTGLIVPTVATALALRARWPGQVEVLVDACQWRLAPATVRAYLAHGCAVALTGSKFAAGPTFSGALLVPPALLAAHRDGPLDAGAALYSGRADWPAGWGAAAGLPPRPNFGLLLRWEAALAELRGFHVAPAAPLLPFLDAYGTALAARLAADPCFEALPLAPLERGALGAGQQWDSRPTIFPFLLYQPDRHGGRRPLARAETARLHRLLRHAPDQAGLRYQLGQPVLCGARDGVPVSALRLCLSAPMLANAGTDPAAAAALASTFGALDQLVALIAAL